MAAASITTPPATPACGAGAAAAAPAGAAGAARVRFRVRLASGRSRDWYHPADAHLSAVLGQFLLEIHGLQASSSDCVVLLHADDGVAEQSPSSNLQDLAGIAGLAIEHGGHEYPLTIALL
jgi:hypothetical protein